MKRGLMPYAVRLSHCMCYSRTTKVNYVMPPASSGW